MLERIDEKYQRRVIDSLKWLAFSVRPLTVDELAEIFIIRPDDKVVIDENEGRFPCTHDVLVYFSGLITTEEISKRRIVRLAHFSIKEYLTSGRARQHVFSFSETDAHLFIASSCLAYHIHLSNLSDIVNGNIYELKGYAALNWAVHLEMVPLSSWPDEVLQKAARSLSPRSETIFNMVCEHENVTRNKKSGRYMYVGGSGYADVTVLLERPLCYIARRGFVCLTQLLLSPKIPINKYLTQQDLDEALYEAVDKGRKEVVVFLLSRGANMTATRIETDWFEMPTNALQTPIHQENTAMVSLLLDYGADLDAQREGRSLALQTAAGLGRLDIMKLLMQSGADVNMCETGKEKKTALYRAASKRKWKAFDLLLERSAKVDRGGHSTYDYTLRELIASRGPLQEIADEWFSRIKRLLELGADPNARDEDSQTAIHLACGHWIVIDALDKAVQVVQLLIDHGADVNMVGGRYGTALQACAYFGNVPVAELLLKNGAIVETQAGEFGYALQAACRRGDSLAMVRLLLDHGAAVDAIDSKYGTAMQTASSGNSSVEEKVRLLLERGADVNVQGGEYGNALQALCAGAEWNDDNYMDVDDAASDARVSTASLLLNRGADVNAQRGQFGTALQAACFFSRLDIVQLLLDHGADINIYGGEYGTALQAACTGYRPDIKIIRLLLDRGADINIYGGEYTTALQAICVEKRPDIEIIRLLLDRSVDSNVSCGKYTTALQAVCAWERPDVKIIRLLLDHGADSNVSSGKYQTILQTACVRLHIDIVQLLLDRGANINVQGEQFGTALQAACFYSRLNAVQLLLDRGADINIYGGEYRTALQAACASLKLDSNIIQLLLDRGADSNILGGKYGTALQAACARDKPTIEVIRLLLDRGADINISSGKYRTALQAACARGRPSIGVIRLLLDRGANVLESGGEHGSAWNAAVTKRKEDLERYNDPYMIFLQRHCPHTTLLQDSDPYTTLLQLLLEHGANVNHVINKFGSALHYVLSPEVLFGIFKDKHVSKHVVRILDLEKRWISRICFLLDNGADVNLNRGMYGFPLQVVCAIEYQGKGFWMAETYRLWVNVVPKVIEILLLHDHARVDINACGGIFGTALQAAAYSGQTKSVHLLLKGGSHVACSDRCGKYRSALNAAVVKGHWDIVDILLKAGAKPDCHLQSEIDEEWLAQIREKDGREAEARYRKFWEVESELYWQTLLGRGRHVAYYHFVTAWLLFRFHMLIRFMATYTSLQKRSSKK